MPIMSRAEKSQAIAGVASAVLYVAVARIESKIFEFNLWQALASVVT